MRTTPPRRAASQATRPDVPTRPLAPHPQCKDNDRLLHTEAGYEAESKRCRWCPCTSPTNRELRGISKQAVGNTQQKAKKPEAHTSRHNNTMTNSHAPRAGRLGRPPLQTEVGAGGANGAGSVSPLLILTPSAPHPPHCNFTSLPSIPNPPLLAFLPALYLSHSSCTSLEKLVLLLPPFSFPAAARPGPGPGSFAIPLPSALPLALPFDPDPALPPPFQPATSFGSAPLAQVPSVSKLEMEERPP